MSDSTGGASRRKILKGAAWTAPVVVMASAAPAFAASGPAALTTRIEAYDGGGKLTVIPTITNANTGAAGHTTLAITATPTVGTISDADPVLLSSGAGFVFVSRTAGPGPARNYLFETANVPGASSPTGTAPVAFAFEVPVTGPANQSSGTITAVPTPTNGNGTPGSGTWT